MCSHDESMNKKILKYTSIQKSPGPAAYKLKPTIGPDATDPSIENNPKISIKGRYTLEVSTYIIRASITYNNAPRKRKRSIICEPLVWSTNFDYLRLTVKCNW